MNFVHGNLHADASGVLSPICMNNTGDNNFNKPQTVDFALFHNSIRPVPQAKEIPSSA